MQRSLLIFLNSLKSKETQERYQYLIDAFIQYYKLKAYDDLILNIYDILMRKRKNLGDCKVILNGNQFQFQQ